MVFASDPDKIVRKEDPLLGWSFKEYFEDPD